MSRIRIAQIGCGYWGPNLIRSFRAQPNVEVTAVAENDPQRRAFVETQFPGVQAVEHPEAAIDLADAVILATPAETHYPLARKALEAGKHVLVEKPLARTVREVDELGALARAAGKILMAGHTFLYHGVVREVRRMIEAGELGDVRYIYSQRLNLGRVRSDVDALWNFAPHDVSIMQYWTGGTPPSKVTRSGKAFLQPGVEDVCFLSLEYPHGPLGHIHVSWLDPVRTRRMVVVGSRKMAVYDDVAEKKLAIHDKGVDVRAVLGEKMDYDLSGQPPFAYKDGEVRWPHIPWEEPLKVQARHFLECIRTGEEPLTGVGHAREVVAILESASQGQR
jgi:predicted dehydrogenase